MFLNYLSLAILLVALTVVFYTFIYIHDIPYDIAKHRNHPQDEAIHVAGWLSLFTLHAIWPIVFIWAVSKQGPINVAPHRRGTARRRLGPPAQRNWKTGCAKLEKQLAERVAQGRQIMIELILGTYGVGCWLVFKKFRLIPVTTYTVCTAILGGIVLFMGILIMLSMCHPGDPRRPVLRRRHADRAAGPRHGDRGARRAERAAQRGRRAVPHRAAAVPTGSRSARSRAGRDELEVGSAQRATGRRRGRDARKPGRNLASPSRSTTARRGSPWSRPTDQIAQTKSRLEFANAQPRRVIANCGPSGAITQQAARGGRDAQSSPLDAELNQAESQPNARPQEKLASGGDRLQAAREALKRAEAEERQARLALEAESDGMNPEVRQTLAQLELQALGAGADRASGRRRTATPPTSACGPVRWRRPCR